MQQLESHGAHNTSTSQGSLGGQGSGKLTDGLRGMSYARGQDALAPRETRRRLVQLPQGAFVLERLSPTAFVDVTSTPATPGPAEHERAQAEGLGLARERLREATAAAAQASANGLPSPDGLSASYDQALAAMARPDVSVTRAAPVEWLVKDEGPFCHIDVNAEARPNLHALVHGRHLDLAATMSGRIRRFAKGGQPPDAAMDLRGLQQTIELGLVAGVAPQVEAGKDARSLDHRAINDSLVARARPSLQRYGYEFAPQHLDLLDGAKKYTAPASELVQEGMVGSDTNLTVVASADATETAKETGMPGEKKGKLSRLLQHAMLQYPELSLAEVMTLVMKRSPKDFNDFKQTPEAIALGGDDNFDGKKVDRALAGPAPIVSLPEAVPEEPKKKKGFFSALFGASGEDEEATKGPEADPTMRALVIGAWQYQHCAQLPGALNDASTWSSLLRGRKYGVEQVTAQDATTGEGLHAVVAAFFASLEPGTKAVFQFSGHGSAPGDSEGEGLVGTDYVPASKRTKPSEVRTILRYTTLYRLVAEARQKGVEIDLVLDCCHSGQMVDLVREGYDASREAVTDEVRAERLLLYRNELRALDKMLRAHHEGALKAPDQRLAGKRNIKRYDADVFDLAHAQTDAYDSQTAVRAASERVPGMMTELNELLGTKSVPAYPGPDKGVAAWMELVAKIATWVGGHYDRCFGERALEFQAAPW